MSAALVEPRGLKARIWARDELDWYVEPVRATEALLSVERFVGPIYDPACGGGNIVRTLLAAGYEAWGTDILQRVEPAPAWFDGAHDFLGEGRPPLSFTNIVMNPPFYRAKGAEAFIRKALALASGKVAAFVDIRFIAGADRAAGLFADHPPARIWIITPRVSCPPGTYLAAGNKAGNGSSDWCWLVWDRTGPSAGTQMGWLRRDRESEVAA